MEIKADIAETSEKNCEWIKNPYSAPYTFNCFNFINLWRFTSLITFLVFQYSDHKDKYFLILLQLN